MGTLDSAPPTEEEGLRKKTRRIIARRLLWGALCVATVPVFVHFAHKWLPPLWENLHFVNFTVAAIPTILSILFAFIIDKDLERHMKKRWRLSIIAVGLLYSTFLWHQQTLQDAENTKETANAVGEAVKEANQHSDGKFKEANQHSDQKFQEVEGDVTSLGVAVDTGLKKATGDIDTNLSKVGKPDPPERPTFDFSFWKDGLMPAEFPLESEQLLPEADGGFKIRFAIRNNSSVMAEGIEEWVQICDSCTFVSEPKGFDKPEGSGDHTRHRVIPGIQAGVTVVDGNEFEVNPPNPYQRFSMVFRVTCNTCGPVQTTKEYWVSPQYSVTPQ